MIALQTPYGVMETPEQQYEYQLVLAALDCADRRLGHLLSTVTTWFDPTEITDPYLRFLYSLAVEVAAAGGPVNAGSLAAEVAQRQHTLGPLWGTLWARCTGDLFSERVREMAYLIHDAAAQAGNILFYARRVHDAYRRTLGSQDVGRAASALAHAPVPDDILDQLPAIRTRYAPAPETRIHDNKQVFLELMEELDGRQVSNALPFGIESLDDLAGGLAPGVLCTVSGRSSSGKSVLLLQTAIRFADEYQIPVVFYTFEMTVKELGRRGAALLSRQPIKGGDTRQYMIGLSRMHELTDVHGRLKLITTARTPEQISSECHQFAAMEPIGLIVVDYLQITTPTDSRVNREQQVAHVAESLKHLAMDLGVPVLTGSQLNADGQVRESRAIENFSNLLLELDPPAEDTSAEVQMDIHVRKNRDGARGHGKALWERPLYTMRDLEAIDLPNFNPDFASYA